MEKTKETELKVKDILKLSTKENYFEFLEQNKDNQFTGIDYSHVLIMNDIFNLHTMHLKSIMFYQKVSKNFDINDIMDNVEPFDLLDAQAWDFTIYILNKVFTTEKEKTSEITC